MVQLLGGGAGAARGIEERRVELVVGRLEVDEEPQYLVMDSKWLGVGPIDLVDGNDGAEPERQGLPSDKPGLRHGSFRRVHQDENPIHHPEDTLDLTPKVRVTRGVHDVDLGAVPAHRRVLGKDGDASFPLQRVRVHHPLLHLLVGPNAPACRSIWSTKVVLP